MSTVEIKRIHCGGYKINITDDYHNILLTLPDSNWYNLNQVKTIIENLGTTCIDLVSLPEYDKKFLLDVV
jgi:hypothetical protein